MAGGNDGSVSRQLSFATSASMAPSTQGDDPELPTPTLSYEFMHWLVKEECLEADWLTRQHIHLDFSDSSIFLLNSFHPEGFDWGGKPTKDSLEAKAKIKERGGADAPEMPSWKLVSMNLNKNKLNDSLFEFKLHKTKSLTGHLFPNLRILKLNDNLLSFPQILLPQLRELYLSRNEIVWIPPLGGMPKLEVLVLSHNQIVQIKSDQFESDKGIPRLKTLDLQSNSIDIKPEKSHGLFMKFKEVLDLQILLLKDNPFCSYYSEYQMLAIYHLPSLEKLDDLDVEAKLDEPDSQSSKLRDEMKTQASLYFGVDRLDKNALREQFKQLNKVVDERRKPSKSLNVNEERKRAPRVPTLPDIVKLLDDAIAEPDSANTYITLAFEDACNLLKAGPDQLRKLIDADRKGIAREALMTFVQLALILVERYPESRIMLLKAIAKFSMVAEKPLAAIAHLAMGGGAPIAEVMKVLEDDALKELAKPMSADSFRIVIIGLAQFDPDCEELAEAIKKFQLVEVLTHKLQPLMHSFLGETDPQGPFQAALLQVLRCAVRKRENAEEAMSLCDELANRMSDVKEFHDKDRYNTMLYLNVTEILCSCIKINTVKALKDIDSKYPDTIMGLVAVALNNLKIGDTTDRLDKCYCKKIAAIIEVITAILRDPPHMDEILRLAPGQAPGENQLMKLILRAPSETSTDPLILGASLDCCTHILRNAPPSVHEKYLQLITIDMDLQKDNKVLPYLDVKKFKDLYRRCASHQAVTTAEERSILTASVPEFQGVTNRYVHKCIASIVRFLGVFSLLEDDPKDKELCNFISKVMDDMGRDRFLLKLLEMPSDEVRVAVLDCLKTVDASQLQEEEIDQMFEMLNPDDVKKEEQLMGQILGLFLTLVQDESEESNTFCLKYGKEVLMKTIEILSKNAERNTHGVEQDETQKAELSLRGVELLFVASKKKDMRRHMRSAHLTMEFKTILQNEMTFNSIKVQDINLEICWTGRSVENLMACLTGADRLKPNKRQGFRIINRIADVMEGGSDNFRRFDIRSEERAAKEAHMWADHTIKTQIMYVDDSEYSDRTNQQQSFVSFHAVNRLLTFLEGHPSATKASLSSGGGGDSDVVTGSSDSQVSHDDHIAHARAFFRDVKQHAHQEVKRAAEQVKIEFDRDTEKEVDMNEEEAEEIVDHEDMLRHSYMENGWQVNDSAQKAAGFSIPPQPKVVKLDESYFIPGTDDETSLVYPLAAVLRALYALLIVPSVERLRLEIITTLREVSLQSRICKLIEAHGRMVDCHVAAKYLRVMSLALRMAPDQTVMHMTNPADHEYVLGLSMSASFASRCLMFLTPLLSNMGRGYVLTLQQQTLCIETMRMFAVISSAAPYVKLSSSKEIQKTCTEYLLTHFIPMPVVNSIVLCLLYDMQVNVGSSHGEFINVRYVRSSMQRQGLREFCCEVLTNIIHSCPAMRYNIFELFYRHEVLGKVALRTSFLSELIQKVAHQKYVFSMEVMIQEKNYEPGERILRCCQCDMPLMGSGAAGFLSRFRKAEKPRMLVLTNKRFLVMERPKHGLMTQKCGHCPPESFCPIGPNIEIERSYADLTRVIRGMDSQMFALGWVRRSLTTGFAETTIEGEDIDIIVVHSSDARRQIIETLCTLSGPDVEKRVEPQRDMLIKQTSEKRLETSPVCMSFAYHVETGEMVLFILAETSICEVGITFENWLPPFEPGAAPDVSDDEGEAKLDDGGADSSMMADDNVKPDKTRLVGIKLQTRAQAWLSGQADKPGMQYNSIWVNREWVNREGDSIWVNLDIDTVLADRQTAMTKTRRNAANAEKGGSEGAGDGGQNHKHVLQNIMRRARKDIFSFWNVWKMEGLEAIKFDAGEQPLLELSFKTDKVTIRFLDDVARERWRRGLAYILNKSDTAAQWQRKWDSAEVA